MNIEIIKSLFLVLFPTVRSYINFCLIWVFLLVLLCNPEESLVVLVSALGMIYCFNEWSKEDNLRKQK